MQKENAIRKRIKKQKFLYIRIENTAFNYTTKSYSLAFSPCGILDKLRFRLSTENKY